MSKQNSQYEIEAIVSFDNRGQLVIPKDLRKKFELKPGDKFALISCVPATDESCDSEDESNSCCDGSRADSVCCFTLVNTNQLQGFMKKFMSPEKNETQG